MGFLQVHPIRASKLLLFGSRARPDPPTGDPGLATSPGGGSAAAPRCVWLWGICSVEILETLGCPFPHSFLVQGFVVRCFRRLFFVSRQPALGVVAKLTPWSKERTVLFGFEHLGYSPTVLCFASYLGSCELGRMKAGFLNVPGAFFFFFSCEISAGASMSRRMCWAVDRLDSWGSTQRRSIGAIKTRLDEALFRTLPRFPFWVFLFSFFSHGR